MKRPESISALSTQLYFKHLKLNEKANITKLKAIETAYLLQCSNSRNTDTHTDTHTDTYTLTHIHTETEREQRHFRRVLRERERERERERNEFPNTWTD